MRSRLAESVDKRLIGPELRARAGSRGLSLLDFASMIIHPLHACLEDENVLITALGEDRFVEYSDKVRTPSPSFASAYCGVKKAKVVFFFNFFMFFGCVFLIFGHIGYGNLVANGQPVNLPRDMMPWFRASRSFSMRREST